MLVHFKQNKKNDRKVDDGKSKGLGDFRGTLEENNVLKQKRNGRRKKSIIEGKDFV